MSLNEALDVVKAAGYRVSKPRAKNKRRPGLNVLGLPISPLFNPNYRMKYKTPRVPYGGASTAANTRNARHAYSESMKRKHSDDAVLIKEIYQRQSII